MLQNFFADWPVLPKSLDRGEAQKTASFLDWILGQLSLVLKRKAVFDAA
ncbi:hypothetical protein TR2A62_3223 [Thalassobium sp. R2A62]|nr:hypothetical protein TR2A62_3223 [Thalassobium sp. R2A62]